MNFVIKIAVPKSIQHILEFFGGLIINFTNFDQFCFFFASILKMKFERELKMITNCNAKMRNTMQIYYSTKENINFECWRLPNHICEFYKNFDNLNNIRSICFLF